MARRSNAELSEATRDALLVGARTAFAKHGYADAPLEDLVRSVGMTKGALYHHFGSKKGLFLAVAEDIDADIKRRIRKEVPGNLVSVEEFVVACRVYLEATLEPGVRRILLLDFPAVVGFRKTRKLDQLSSIEPISEALQELISAGQLVGVDVEATAHLINGALYEAALWIGESATPRPAIRRALDSLRHLLTGLSPNPPKKRQAVR